MKKILAIILSLMLIAFVLALALGESSKVTPHTMYRADFLSSSISDVEKCIDTIAKENGLRIFRKDRQQMSTLTNGQPAFFTALYYQDDPVMTVTNVAVGTILSISISDYGKIPISELELILSDFTSMLEQAKTVDNLQQYVWESEI